MIHLCIMDDDDTDDNDNYDGDDKDKTIIQEQLYPHNVRFFKLGA